MRSRVPVAVTALLISCLMSHVSCPPVGAEELKIAYVNMAELFDNYERTKSSDADLERRGKQKEVEFETRLNELKKLRQGLELLNDQTREAKARDIEERSDELQRFRASAARELRRERDRIAKQILQEIQQAVQDYAKANGFSLVLDDRSVLYGQPVYDATQEILVLLNSRYASAKAR